jgi:hypothetical protein
MLPNERSWHWHECARCESIIPGALLRRNKVAARERPVIIVFQTGVPEFFTPLIADLHQLPFVADDSTSECGGMLPRPWAWEDLSPSLLAAVRSKGKIFLRR